MSRDPKFVLNYLREVEELAEDVLADKQQIIDLDKKRQSNRAALSVMRKKETLAPPHSVHKCWVNFGGVFFKMKKGDVMKMVEEDQRKLEVEIKELRDGLHDRVNQLRDAQGDAPLSFHLKPISQDELDDMRAWCRS